MDRLWAMEVFVKVVEAGSLSRAAARLDLANASVTTCIRNLEAHLGVTLLRRNTRHVAPTDEGLRYYAQCRDILAQVETAEAGMAAGGERLSGTLRVEVPIALGHLIIGPALADFAARHPDLQVVVSLTNSVDDLIRGGVDVAIRIDRVEDEGLVARRIYEARHVLCAAPDFLARHGAPDHPGAIDPKHCLGFAASLAAPLRPWQFRRGEEAVEIAPRGNLAFNSSDALLRTAARGAGFVYVLDVLAHSHLAEGKLVALLPGWETAPQSFLAVYPAFRFIPPRVRAFVQFLTAAMRGG
ncbi:LysR family transcriptional regulator [Falsiroseomonas sp. CW058]|uniref:LysR family transcriptional regulator n=1 Tax=Falsiroseomonas sp. CW058 TaxID=3388664 RepID=UPI003D313214